MRNHLSLFFVLGSFGLSAAPAVAQEGEDTEYENVAAQMTVEEELNVVAKRIKETYAREDIRVGSDRFFRGPYGNKENIIRIGQELKNRGDKKRIFTRGIKMPQTYAASSLDSYKYVLADECGIQQFRFYEGADFRALGLKQGDREILFDVLVGAAFTGPGIWGPYDQIVGRRHKMEPIMGDAGKDGLGLHKGGYMIGQKADLPGSEMMETGEVYTSIVDTTAQCLADKLNREAAGRVLSSN